MAGKLCAGVSPTCRDTAASSEIGTSASVSASVSASASAGSRQNKKENQVYKANRQPGKG